MPLALRSCRVSLIAVTAMLLSQAASAQVTFDLIVPSAVTLRTGGIIGLTSTNWGWIVATDQTLEVADLDALVFSASITDFSVTPQSTFLLNNGQLAPLAPGDVAGKTQATYQALLEPGEALVNPGILAFMQFGYSFPAGHTGSSTSTVTVTSGTCAGSYDVSVTFVNSTTSPRLVVNSAQRVSVLCADPVPDPTSLFRAYHETLIGESGLPTSPEIDAIGAGSLSSTTSNAASSVVFNGTVARATAVDDFASGLGEHAQLNLSGGDVGERDFMLRITFDDLVLSGAGEQFDLLMLLSFGSDGLIVGLDEFGALFIGKFFAASGTIVPLPGAAITAIQGGASFTLELWMDRSADAAFAAIEVEGQGRTEAPAFPAGLAGQAFASAITFPRIIGPGLGGQLQLDFTEVELFLNASNKVPATGPLGRLVLVLLLLSLPRLRRRH